MRLSTKLFSVGLALATFVPAAEAADWNRGSVKDRGGIAVPAPIPVVETFKWYLRADVGVGLTSEPDIAEQGMTFGYDRDPVEGPAFGMNPSWFNPDFDTFMTGGVGVGMYLTPRLRTDATFDVRTKSTVTARGAYSYRLDPALALDRRIDGNVHESTEVRTSLLMANLYWDLAERGTRFVPYVGVGAGFAVRSVDRRHATQEDMIDTLTGAGVGVTSNFEGKSKAHQLAPAVSATAGLAYTLDTGMVLDLNYRFTYVGEVDFSTNVAYGEIIAGRTGANSRMTIGDSFDHALRAGIRWNVW